MNKIFNLIWSSVKEKWIVVSEKVKSGGGHSGGGLSLASVVAELLKREEPGLLRGPIPVAAVGIFTFLATLLTAGSTAFALDPGALPTGGQITSGNGSIATIGNQIQYRH